MYFYIYFYFFINYTIFVYKWPTFKEAGQSVYKEKKAHKKNQ